MKPEDVLRFWFGPSQTGYSNSKLWYMGGKEIDQKIQKKFGTLLNKARQGKLSSWEDTPLSRLALIIVLDQFSRNIYRKKKEAFAQDAYALRLCKEGITSGMDKSLDPIQRLFFYMPLEHSEDLGNQNLLLRKVARMLPREPKHMLGFLRYAWMHRKIIKQFGRFPHRNKVLKRKSTEEELAYLKNASTFGQ